MSQAESPADQAAAGENLLYLLRRRAGGNVEILRHLAQQQVANTAADDKSLEAGVLQFTNDIGGVRTELLQPDPVLGLGDGDKLVDGGLRYGDRLNVAVRLV
jgi:hypothetical protein